MPVLWCKRYKSIGFSSGRTSNPEKKRVYFLRKAIHNLWNGRTSAADGEEAGRQFRTVWPPEADYLAFLIAIKKRPVSVEQVAAIAEGIEQQCANAMRSTVTSVDIGNWVMEHLKRIDAVAYIDLPRFMRILQTLQAL